MCNSATKFVHNICCLMHLVIKNLNYKYIPIIDHALSACLRASVHADWSVIIKCRLYYLLINY